MDISVPGQDYTEKARKAEEFALQTSDLVTRNTWLRIAESYRHLAEFVQAKSLRGYSWRPEPTAIRAKPS